MDNRIQSNFGAPAPAASNVAETRTSNMYILQVKSNNAQGPLEAEAIPLHMLINVRLNAYYRNSGKSSQKQDQDTENEQYLISVLQAKPLQLFIDPQGQISTNGNAQYYEIPTPESQIANDFTSSLQIINNLNSTASDLTKGVDHENEVIPENSLTNVTLDSSELEKEYNSAVKNVDTSEKKVVQRFVHIKDVVVPPRAVAVLPAALQLRRGVVSPRRALPDRVRFGPVEGINQVLPPAELQSLVSEATSSNLPIFLLKTDDDQTVHIDVSDKDKSNWLSLLPLEQSSANVWLYQQGGALFAVGARALPARAPLVLGYSREYARAHALPGPPGLSVDAELATPQRQWWCRECPRAVSSAALLQRHIHTHHMEERQRAQQRYRCRHCTRTFCRMFTLRRHIARHCTKKDKQEVVNETPESVPAILESKPEELPELTLNSTHADDSRLPSDESLQTSLLSNNLDFPTNLFDTDRIPNLDISGSSKSDNDFNPYSLGFKDDIGLANAIDFEIGTDACNGSKEMKIENEESLLLTCRYCNQTVIKGRQRQHVRNCEGRKFRCECGRAFMYKEKLALHIRLDHGDEERTETQQRLDNAKESEDPQYKCETCMHTFKRRGMLVNHLWRVHKNVSTAVPLERRVRHYPCGTCPKLYRAAAKRDRHVRAHHPGAAVPGGAIEGGRRSCPPAACAACPRQYATRAKLLQHVRAQHPLLAPPVKRRTTKKK